MALRVARGVLAGCLGLVAVACGGGADRPAPAELGSTSLYVTEHEEAADGTCAPGSSRACTEYWRDEAGRLHCPSSLQFCFEDGSGFGTCGDYAVNADGEPVPAWSVDEEDGS